MYLWTSPLERSEPFGTCGQPVDNIPVAYSLTTLSDLSPTGSTGTINNLSSKDIFRYSIEIGF